MDIQRMGSGREREREKETKECCRWQKKGNIGRLGLTKPISKRFFQGGNGIIEINMVEIRNSLPLSQTPSLSRDKQVDGLSV